MPFASYIYQMKDEWTQHRFSGGALALDLVNTVVRRSDLARAFDRLASADDVNLFALAAAKFRAQELGGEFQFSSASETDFRKLLELRERIYSSFAPPPLTPAARLNALSRLLGASERALAQAGPESLLCHAVHSWMRLNTPEKRAKLRACPACDWLFLDMSRNGSRIWCDMAVCGNRQKSRLNYHRKRRQ
jgi:predicted RNA-binding Zn ribbon-like protein